MKIILRQAALLLLALSFLAVALASVSCGTARGLGRDIGHLGDGIERVAR